MRTGLMRTMALGALLLTGACGGEDLPKSAPESCGEGNGTVCAGLSGTKTCSYKGQVYQDQEVFKDDCNSCQCNPEGTEGVSCSLMNCTKPGGKTCSYKGQVYQDQEVFKDDCNSCQCNPEGTEGVSCSLMNCTKPGGKTCSYKGQIYQDQEVFTDGSSSCMCNPEGTVGVGCSM